MKLSYYPIVYTGVTAIGASANPSTFVGGQPTETVAVIPVNTTINPINVFGQITDGGVSTYALQYTTADVFSPTFNPATASNWTTISGAPTTGTAAFNITGLGCTGIRLNVTTGPATVTLGPIFQSDASTP